MVSTLDIRINMNIRTRYSRVRYDIYIYIRLYMNIRTRYSRVRYGI